MAVFDFVIVGQGIAGTTLAWSLRWSNCRVLVIDRDEPATASRVAAGLMTPITGRRLARSWRLDDLWPAAVASYRRAEVETGTTFFHLRRVVRLFRDEGEREIFERRKDSAFRGWAASLDHPLRSDWFTAPLGGFEMPTAGQLAVTDYLEASRRHFVSDGGFVTGDVNLREDVEVSPEGVRLPRMGVSARGVVFCQGVAAVGNPWFPRVILRKTRGDILTLRTPGLTEDRIVNRGVWLAPIGDGVFRAGATYDHTCLEPIPTAAGRSEVCARLREFLRLPFEVLEHRAGLRPVAVGNRPLLGRSLMEPRIGYFNGLGSKGALAAPYFADQLAAALTGDGAIDAEVDVAGPSFPRS